MVMHTMKLPSWRKRLVSHEEGMYLHNRNPMLPVVSDVARKSDGSQLRNAVRTLACGLTLDLLSRR
jgi:hypothetical protein